MMTTILHQPVVVHLEKELEDRNADRMKMIPSTKNCWESEYLFIYLSSVYMTHLILYV